MATVHNDIHYDYCLL